MCTPGCLASTLHIADSWPRALDSQRPQSQCSGQCIASYAIWQCHLMSIQAAHLVIDHYLAAYTHGG